jgi:hypothetical protein
MFWFSQCVDSNITYYDPQGHKFWVILQLPHKFMWHENDLKIELDVFWYVMIPVSPVT